MDQNQPTQQITTPVSSNSLQPQQSIIPTQTQPPSVYGKRNWKKWVLIYLAVAIVVYAGVYYFFLNKQSNYSSTTYKAPTQPTPTKDPTANWKTYTDQVNGFELNYPPTLSPDDNLNTQVFLKKINASDAEKLDQSDEMVKITTDGFMDRFNEYYNTPENNIVKKYGTDVVLKKYTVNGYQTIEYGYLDEKKKIELQESKDSIRTGVSVGMIYFDKGLVINKKGTIIEISTKSYYGDFKTTFDQILSTFKFTTTDSMKACTQEAKLCPDGSSVGRTGPNCEFAPCPTLNK